VDRAEVLYDAFKETFIQIRKIYLINTLLGVFALLILLLVFRDTLLIQNFQPKMTHFDNRIKALSTEIERLTDSKLQSPTQYRRIKLDYDAAKLELDTWPNDLPARKKMKQKYESYLKDYSGSHEKVVERLKIDGEPGLDLFMNLQDTIKKMEVNETKFNKAKQDLSRNKRKHAENTKKKIASLEAERTAAQIHQKKLQQESSRIQKDKTRLPWLGLRINPRDILAFIPLLLLLSFHALFDRIDEILTISKNPLLHTYKDELQYYPVSVFMRRYNGYSALIRLLTYMTIPAIQIMATLLILQSKPITEFNSGVPWSLSFGISVTACIATLAYPIYVLWRHRDSILGKPETTSDGKETL